MQFSKEDLVDLKIRLRTFNKNYSDAIVYCTLATLGGLELADQGVHIDSSFLRYAGDAIAVVGGTLTMATSGMMAIVNQMARKEFSLLENKTQCSEIITAEHKIAA